MSLLSILAAAEAEAHHSETPFFLIGGALAVFAIIVGAFGIVRPTWGGGVINVVMGVGALLALGTMVSIVAVS